MKTGNELRNWKMLTLKFQATNADGKTVRFNVREPNGADAYRNAWDRAVKIATTKGWANLKFSD